MTRAERIKILREYQASIKNKKLNFDPDAIVTKEYDDRLQYHRLRDVLFETSCYDLGYSDHLSTRKNWSLDKEMTNINNLTYRMCCAILTLIWRKERVSAGYEDWYVKNVNNGNIYKLIDRLIETMPSQPIED